MLNISDIKFDENGLIPAVVQDYYTKEVLTLAYMNSESLKISIQEQKTCFYSRSRKELWRKGETSGNYQHIVTRLSKTGLLATLAMKVVLKIIFL